MKRNTAAFFIFLCLATFLNETAAQAGRGSYGISARQVITPSGFYISSIVDERNGEDSTGTVLFSANGQSVTHKVALESCTLPAIRRNLMSSVVRDTSLRPLIVRIREYNAQEALASRDRVNGKVNLALMFDLDKKGWSIPLTQYKTTARYTRTVNNMSIVEPTLRDVLLNSIKFIDRWIDTAGSGEPGLAKDVKLSFNNYLEQHDDTVYYDPARPLRWDDFRETRSDEKYAAAVFPSFGYDQRTEVKNGVIMVELAVKVYMVKSASWVGPGSRTSYNLNHEQRHFDLVRLVADRFKKKLLSEKLTPDNYLGTINYEYLEFYREMNKVQREYDEQTSHGKATAAQQFWNSKIDAGLAQIND